MGVSRKTSIIFDEPSEAILRRRAGRGDKSAYVRAAVIEKAARDEYRDELSAQAARITALEARVAQLENPRKTIAP